MTTIQSNMEYQEYTLSCGLKVVHRHLPGQVTYLGIAVGVGSRDENNRQHGLAHFTEHLLFKGTKRRNAQQIIRRIEGVGGELNAYTSKEETLIYTIFPKEYFRRSIHLLADIVTSSTFPKEELEREKTVIIDEISSYEDSPSELIFDEFEHLLFRGHTLGHPILGTERSVNSFSHRMQCDFFRQHYRVDNMVLFAQGDIPFDQLLEQAELHFASTTFDHNRASLSPDPIRPAVQKLPARTTVRRRQTHQRHILMGGYAYSMHERKKLGLSILVNLLGGSSMNSRLNLLLREQHGFVYHIECTYTAYTDIGMVAIYFGCASEHMQEAITLVEGELRRLCQEPLTEDELIQTKRQLKGQLTVANDNPETTFLSLGKTILHHGKQDSLEELCAKIDAIGIDELHEIAREIFPPEQMHRLIYT